MARITLTRFGAANIDFDYVSGHRIRVEASDEIDMPAEIFMWHRGPVDGSEGDYLEWYERVANLSDLANYPADEPDEDNDYPEFRRSYFEIDVGSFNDVDEVWTNVKDGVQRLVDSINLYGNLQTLDTEDIE